MTPQSTTDKYVAAFAASAVLGPTLEWAIGKLSARIGTAPYIYPASPLRYTSFEVVPLWGFAGVIGVALYEAYRVREGKYVRDAILAAALAAGWVIINERLESRRA